MIPFGNHFCHIKANHNQGKPLRAVSAERVSHRASFLSGSMTVEASLVLPLFLFFMAEILSIFDMIRLQSRFLQALHETGTQMSEYAFYTRYAVPGQRQKGTGEGEDMESFLEGEEGLSGAGISLILSETWVRSSVEHYLGTDYLNHTCLAGGAPSVSYLQSQIMNGTDRIDVVADYRIRPFLPMFGLSGFCSQSRYYGHAWTGYEIGEEEGTSENEDPEEMVYITRTGSVYHRNRSCTYLKPSTRLVAGSRIGNLRSRDGSKYYACEVCHPSRLGNVVIADYGNRYHSSSSCSSIHRDVTEVPLSQVEDTMRPCSKCGGH